MRIGDMYRIRKGGAGKLELVKNKGFLKKVGFVAEFKRQLRNGKT